MAAMIEIYNHTIVGRFNPQNGCFIDDGSQLFVLPLKDVPLRDAVGHEFSSTRDVHIKSIFGWADETKPFVIDDLLSIIPASIDRDCRLIEH